MPSAYGTHTKTPATYAANKYFYLLLIISLVFLSACSQLPTKAVTKAAPQKTTTALVKESKNASPKYLEALLEAEFTLQREGPDEAFEPFYKLANQSKDLPLIERLSKIAIVTQNSQDIERSTNLWLSVAPTAEQAYALKLQVLVKEKRIKETTGLLEQAIQNKVPLHFLPLYLDTHVRDNEQVNTINQALLLLPEKAQQDPDIQLSQARLAFLSGDYEKAKRITKSLIDNSNIDASENEALYLILAYSQEKLGNISAAITTLETATQHFPKSLRLQTPLIDFLVENQQSKEALAFYNSSSLDENEKQQAGINFASTLLEHQQASLALEALALFPTQTLGFIQQVRYLKALAFGQLKQISNAIQTMDEVEGALRTSATHKIALWLYQEGQEGAINDMVLRRTPRESTPEQVIAICQLHEEKGHSDLSFDLLNKALIDIPESNLLRYRKALLSDTLGDWQSTEKELTVLLNKDPDNPQYLNALGYTLLTRTKRLDEAMKYIKSAYEKAEDDPAIIDSLGWGFFLKGELEQASYYLGKAWAILPDAEIGAHYGESLWQQHHYEQAIDIWQEAFKTSPNTPLLLDTIKRLSPSLLKEAQGDTTS